MNSPWHHLINNQKNHIHKAFNYFHAFERHFSRFVGTSATMFEIGVQNGGSAQMWKSYLGPMATIVGIDIDPRCKQVEEHAIHVRIGSQDDHAFLEQVINEFGVPDIVLDDGSHQASHIKSTFEYLFPMMAKNSVYMVEDLCCAY
jgi:cephalosporin hydroxylase